MPYEDFFDSGILSNNESDNTPVIPDVDYDLPTATNGIHDIGDYIGSVDTDSIEK